MIQAIQVLRFHLLELEKVCMYDSLFVCVCVCTYISTELINYANLCSPPRVENKLDPFWMTALIVIDQQI